MKLRFKSLFFNLGTVLLAHLITTALANLLVATVLNAIFGASIGMPLTIVLIYLGIPALSFFTIYQMKSHSAEAKREYLKAMEGKEYDAKEDAREILADRYFRGEAVFSTVLVWLALTWFSGLGAILWGIAFPFFLFFGTKRIHKVWIAERLHH